MKNNKTVQMSPEFETWTNQLNKLTKKGGHKFVRAILRGRRVLKHKTTQTWNKDKKVFGNSYVTTTMQTNLEVNIVINGTDENDIWKFIQENYPEYVFYVRTIYTVNTFGQECIWEPRRQKMLLLKVDGVGHENCSERDLVSAADGLYYDGCKWKPNTVTKGYVCGIDMK